MGYKNKNMFPHPRKKTMGQQFTEDLILLVIACSILYLIQQVFLFLFRPFAKENEDSFGKRIEQKRRDREKRAERIFQNPNDPLHQFHLRFIEKPDEYKDDPGNEIYRSWFEDWTNGKVTDSSLRWVPDVMVDEKISRSFLDYMKLQFDIHKKAGFLSRLIFIVAISRYYPELTASLNGLERDLAGYEAELDEEAVRNELKAEIEKFGLPDGVADYLADKDFGDAMEEKASLLKRLTDKGYSEQTCIFVCEHGVNEDGAKIIDTVVKSFGLPPRIGFAYLNDEITAENVAWIANEMIDFLEWYGKDAFAYPKGSNQTAYDEFLDSYLQECRGKNVINLINRSKK